jgi:hypothetical protein
VATPFVPEVSGTTTDLVGVWGGGGVWIVGGNLVLLRSSTGTWMPQPTPLGGSVCHGTAASVWGESQTDVWFATSAVCGHDVLHYDGVAFNWASNGIPATPAVAIWGDGAGDLWASANGGLIFQATDVAAPTWTQGTSTTTDAIAAGWAGSATSSYAVGKVIRHQTASGTWPTDTAPPATLAGAWGSSATDLYAVGAGGAILHSTGNGTWTPQTTCYTRNLNAVWGSSATDIYAVGDQGEILHSHGAGDWNVIPSGTTSNLYGVGGSSVHDVYAVGAGGTITHGGQ